MMGEIRKTDKNSVVKIGKSENNPTPAATPAPEPPGMGAEYADLWNRAWALADYIDNPDGAPIEARRAKLPELDRMRDRLAEIERQGYGGRFDLSEA